MTKNDAAYSRLAAKEYDSALGDALSDLFKIAGFLLVSVALPEFPEGQPKEGSTLQLSLRPISVSFCLADDEVYAAQFDVELRYLNTTRDPVILSRSATTVIEVLVESADGSSTKLSFDVFYSDFYAKPFGERPDSRFAVLRPGASWRARSKFPVVVQMSGTADVKGAVRPGSHTLTVYVATWDRPDAAQLKKKWTSTGKLSTEVIQSKPMRVDLPADPKVKACK